MGIFSDNVRRYFESGIPCIPCGDKKQPIVGLKWERYCEVLPIEEEIDRWEAQYPDCQRLGMPLGEASGFVIFDFDYEYNEKKCRVSKKEFNQDLKYIEKQILALLPLTPCKKVGKKGWSAVYRYNKLLKNIQCDRYGLRLFDFLVWHKQTIIPPSLHSDNIYYKWIGTPLMDCLDDIPEIDINMVLDIKEMYGHASENEKSRHGDLLKHVLSIAAIENDKEKIITSLIDKDKEINKPTYLDDPKHNKHIDAYKNASLWIDRILKWKRATKPIEVVKTYANETSWAHFFENAFYKVKKDILSKDIYIKNDAQDSWQSINAVEEPLKARADRKFLPLTKVLNELGDWKLNKKDLSFLCEMPAWDGIDRVKEITSSLKSKEFNDDEISDIFKHWGSGIFRRLKSSETQNRCIILKGNQGIGKDTLVKSMLREFKPYYGTPNFSGTQKDVLEVISRLLIVHIEEFEQTRSMDMGFLKSIITQSSAFFRESYGASPNQKTTCPSFISTANVDDILRDPTGNRRFIVINVDSITRNYPLDQSLMVMAQFKHYCEQSMYETLQDVIEVKIKEIIDFYTPDDLSVNIVEMYQDKFRLLTSSVYARCNTQYDGSIRLNSIQVTPSLTQIAKDLQCSLRRVQSVLRSKRFSRKLNDGVHYFGSAE